MKKIVKLTPDADWIGIHQNDKLGVFDVFYTLVEDDAFERLGDELSNAGELMYSDPEYGADHDEVEGWFFENSKVEEWKVKAEEFYNPIIRRNDIRVECKETRVAVVNGIKFIATVTASKSEMYKNREAQKALELKNW